MVKRLDRLKYEAVKELFCVSYLFQNKTVSPLGCKQIGYLNSIDLVKAHNRQTNTDVILGSQTSLFRLVATSGQWLLTFKFKLIKVFK